MSEKKEIRKLEKIATHSVSSEERKQAIDTLAAYGEVSIPAILRVLEQSTAQEVKEHGLKKVKELKEKASK